MGDVCLCRDTFVFYATDLGVSVGNKKILIIPDPQDINGQLRQKSMTSWRPNERCQRPKTSWFDFVFPFAFKNKHRFENFFFVHYGRYGLSVTF